LVLLLAAALRTQESGNVIQDQIEQDGRAFLLKATCRF